MSDDDAGSSVSDAIKVSVTGDADTTKGNQWWLNAYRPQGTTFTSAQLQRYLDVLNYFSLVFSEGRNATNRVAAATVLQAPGKTPPYVLFDQTALGIWLNFANGAVTFDTPVDRRGTTWGEVMLAALARKVGKIEITGEPKRLLNNTLRGLASLPIRISAA